MSISISSTPVTRLQYRFHRGMTRPFFSKDRISHFEIFDRHAADAIEQVKERMREGYAVDIQVRISRYPLICISYRLPGCRLPVHPRLCNRVPLRNVCAAIERCATPGAHKIYLSGIFVHFQPG